MTPAKKHIIYALTTIIASLVILSMVYPLIDKETDVSPAAEKTSAQIREIETPGKKWLNGYLGIFFRFKYLGNINWLIIPLIFYYFFTVTKKQSWRSWQMALFFVWLLTALFIIIKGYTNFRYQFTLFPFTAAVILLILWEILKDKRTYLKIICFSFVGLVSIYNIYHYFDRYDFFWRMKVNEEKSYFPYQLLDYLNRDTALKESGKKVFVLDQPLFFYYTNQKGIDIQSAEAQWAGGHLAKKSGSREALFKEFKKILHVEYILISAAQLKLYRSLMLTEFLDCESRLILKDNGRFLYRLREKSLERELQEPRFTKYELWRHEVNNSNGTSPRLTTFEEKGKFVVAYTRDQKRPQYARDANYIMLRFVKPNEKGERRLNTGYEFARSELKIEIPRIQDRYLHFIVRTAISPTLFNKNNYMFINEYNGDNKTWQAAKIYFSSPYPRTYIVSRKIGKNSQNIILGFRFTPQNPEETLLIYDTRAYVSDDPL